MVEEADANYNAALEAAVLSPDPASAALKLAIEWRDGGMEQSGMIRIFESVLARHRDDADERIYDALLDTMDFITGWCSPHAKLYPDQHS